MSKKQNAIILCHVAAVLETTDLSILTAYIGRSVLGTHLSFPVLFSVVGSLISRGQNFQVFPLLLYHEVSSGMEFKTWVCFLLLPIVVKN